MPHCGEGLTSPQHVFPYAVRQVPLLARAHPLAHPRIPAGALFTYLGPHAVLQLFSKFLWPLTRPANRSCVTCFPVSFARVPGVQGLHGPAVPAVQLPASRDRCFTLAPQVPCPVNLGSMRASGGTWRAYPRRCGDQADPPMMVATLAQAYTQSQCICMVLPRHYPMCCKAPNMMTRSGVRPPRRTAPS